jgi:hypothetical protein
MYHFPGNTRSQGNRPIDFFCDVDGNGTLHINENALSIAE